MAELQDDELADFFCPISGDLIHDPVLADDGHNYERANIQSWFSFRQSRQQSITSPWTRAPMSTNLKDNPILKERIASAVHQHSYVTGFEGISSIHELNAVFAHLDPLRDILSETLQGWRPPQLVVVGPESSGKSTLLERLVMMPIFPKHEGTCTRLPIHVRLRNSQQAQAPRLEVCDAVSGRTEDGPYEVSMQSGAMDIRDKMLELLEREHEREGGVSASRIIVLHVQGQHVPSLDVVDLPGMLLTPQTMWEKTRALVEQQVVQHGAYSMYLAVVSAGTRPNSSMAVEVVKAMGLEGRALGVFTKCDDVSLDYLQSNVLQLISAAPDEALGAVPLVPHGWYATMNKPLNTRDGESNTARLRRQADAEVTWFAKHMAADIAKGRTGCGAVVRGISGMFLSHVREGWAPVTLRRLEKALDAARRENAALGLPALAGKTADEVALTRGLAAKAMLSGVEVGFETSVQTCCKEVLGPLKMRLAAALGPESAAVRAEKVAAVWAAEAQAVQDECDQTIATWITWWEARMTELSEWERAAGSDFVLGRFPLYVDALAIRGIAAVATAGMAIRAAARKIVRKFYDDTSPWTKFTTNLNADPATVLAVRESEQLIERLVLAFLRGGLAVKEGLTAAVGEAAQEVEEWAEECEEARRRVADRITRVEEAKAGVVKALGAASAEELLAGAPPEETVCPAAMAALSVLGDGHLDAPLGVAVDRDGNIIVSDWSSHKVFVFGPDGSIMRTIGSAGAGVGQLKNPFGVAVDQDSNIFVADHGNHLVQVFGPDGTIPWSLGSEGSGEGQLLYPSGVAVDREGNILVSDSGNDRVQIFKPNGSVDKTVVKIFGCTGSDTGQLRSPRGITLDRDGNVIVADRDNNRVQVFRQDGTVALSFGSAGSGEGQMDKPFSVTLDREGNFLVSEVGNTRIQSFRPDGSFIRIIGTSKLSGPRGIAVDRDGKILVADLENHHVIIF